MFAIGWIYFGWTITLDGLLHKILKLYLYIYDTAIRKERSINNMNLWSSQQSEFIKKSTTNVLLT